MFRRAGAFLLDILQVVVFAVAIFLFVYLLILQPHKIKGQSMEPNFHDAEFLLTDKVTYRFNEPERGDVIVFKAPPDGKEEFIKRIIGLPGEKISVKGGSIYINDQRLDEPYLEDKSTLGGNFLSEGQEYTVKPDEYFVLGDNRDHSFDSRFFGPIGRDKITGRAWLIYWPPQIAGTVGHPSYSL